MTTQIFDADDTYLDTDSVFAVKRDLVAVFKPVRGTNGTSTEEDEFKANWEVDFDVVLGEA